MKIRRIALVNKAFDRMDQNGNGKTFKCENFYFINFLI